MNLPGETLGVILESSHQVSFITTDTVHTDSHGLRSSTLRSSTKPAANPHTTSASAELRASPDLHDNGHKQTMTSLPIVSFEKQPNTFDAEQGEDTNTPTITQEGDS